MSKSDSNSDVQGILAGSPAMCEILGAAAKIAPSDVSVLIQGESGTGKELIATAIHRMSQRRNSPMLTVHCGRFWPSLLENELFGREKHAGFIQQANGSTLFLDGISELGDTAQAKLVKFLSKGTFERIGSNEMLTSDIRVVAATDKSLEAEVKAGRFRPDLYFRLAVILLELPPLRERTGDIPLMAIAFLKEIARKNGKGVKDFTPAALETLMNYAWPENMRELRSAVESAIAVCESERIDLNDLPLHVRLLSSSTHQRPSNQAR